MCPSLWLLIQSLFLRIDTVHRQKCGVRSGASHISVSRRAGLILAPRRVDRHFLCAPKTQYGIFPAPLWLRWSVRPLLPLREGSESTELTYLGILPWRTFCCLRDKTRLPTGIIMMM